MASSEELIGRANPEELDLALKAVLARYRTLFPDWELCVFSIEKNKSQEAQFDAMIQFLQARKSNS